MGEHKLRIKSHGFEEMEMSPDLRALLKATGAMSEPKKFRKGELNVLIAQEQRCFDKSGLLKWHMSISTPTRAPSWEEQKDARYALLPMGLYFAQILPPLSEYTNIHPFTYHWWEIDWGPV